MEYLRYMSPLDYFLLGLIALLVFWNLMGSVMKH